MARKLNYTGRRRISQKDVQIEMIRVSDGLAFNAKVNLERYDLPDDSQVWVEAYRRASRMHFPFGTKSEPQVPVDRLLAEFDSADAIQFRVRVTAVGDEHGKLLGVADRIQPAGSVSEDVNTTSLLGLSSAPLNGRVWAVELDENGPFLVLDDQIEDRHIIAGSDAFVSLVLPQAFRDILMHLLILESTIWEEDDDSAWQNKWLDFAQRMPGAGDMPERSQENRDELVEWIDDCTAGFCRGIESMRRFELMRRENEA